MSTDAHLQILNDAYFESDTIAEFEPIISPLPVYFTIVTIEYKMSILTLFEIIEVENKLNDEFIIFPNPASEYFSINLGNQSKLNSVSLSILNCNGEIIYSGEKVIPDAFKLNVSSWPTGIYFIKM